MDTKIVLTVSCLLVLFALYSPGVSYSEQVKTFFTRFSSEYKIDHCITKAKEKMNQFPYKSDDQKFSIAMVNLYTQECGGSFSGSFYSALNREMRNGATGMWKTAGDLMDRAIEILGETYFKVVYRGCSHNVVDVGNTYIFKMITSTSTDPQVAANFASKHGCGTLFILDNVKGVRVSKYSAVELENEVLLKSTIKYDVIEDTMNSLETTDAVKRIIHLDMGADNHSLRASLGRNFHYFKRGVRYFWRGVRYFWRGVRYFWRGICYLWRGIAMTTQ